MKWFRWKPMLAALALAATSGIVLTRARGSDHADTPQIAASPGTDITDVFLFPNPTDTSKVTLVMNVNPLIATGAGLNASFDPNVLYQFKIDNNGDNVEDLVIQAVFEGTGAGQRAHIAGPAAPAQVGAQSVLLPTHQTTGAINTTFNPAANIKVFTGAREDPFFFDLERFFEIFPDRATPITGQAVANPNQPQAITWRAPGAARDFLSANGLNVLSIVVEVPKSALRGTRDGKIRVWCTTSK